MDEQIKVRLYGLMEDPVSKALVMVLKPEVEDRLFPIWIGLHEANAISMELEKISSPRPMTHDLISEIIYCFDGSVDKVVISDMKETTFFAKLYLKKDDEIKIVDCRPSDAIALALKYNSNIYIDRTVYQTYTLSDQNTGFLNNEFVYENWSFNVNKEILDIL